MNKSADSVTTSLKRHFAMAGRAMSDREQFYLLEALLLFEIVVGCHSGKAHPTKHLQSSLRSSWRCGIRKA